MNTVVWCITDGKPGHENQSHGLIDAIADKHPIEVHFLRARTIWQDGRDWLCGVFSTDAEIPSPQLIIAAGHRTHTAALAARRAAGGQVVVLMRPTFPLKWFDLCLVPEHDFDGDSPVIADPRVVTTRGVLNNVWPSTDQEAGRGLMLIGGPSKHHDWDEASLVSQVLEVVRADPTIGWNLTTSRRTPHSVLRRLDKIRFDNLTVTPFEDTRGSWVTAQLAAARTVFVTEDSVSMVYEALSAAADVGLLAVPRRRTSRVIQGVDRLIEERAVIPFDGWREHGFSQRQPIVLQEAERCAQIICERLLDAA